MQIRYFAWLRTRLGRSEDDLALPGEVATVGELIAWLGRQGEPYASALAKPESLRAAVNQDFAGADTPVREGDEVALFPPVTGG